MGLRFNGKEVVYPVVVLTQRQRSHHAMLRVGFERKLCQALPTAFLFLSKCKMECTVLIDCILNILGDCPNCNTFPCGSLYEQDRRRFVGPPRFGRSNEAARLLRRLRHRRSHHAGSAVWLPPKVRTMASKRTPPHSRARETSRGDPFTGSYRILQA